MLARFRHLLGVLFFLLVASCSGGGCSSGCSSCTGLTPLPAGFPKDQTVDNAGVVRVSRPGLDFLEQAMPQIATTVEMAPGGILDIDVPTLSTSKTEIANLGIGQLNVTPNVCPDGPKPTAMPPQCTAQVNLGTSVFTIDAVTPDVISLHATLPLVLQDTPVDAVLTADPIIGSEFGVGSITLYLGYGDGGCTNGAPDVTPHQLPVAITLPIIQETTPPRNGYAKVDIDNAVIDLSGLTDDDVTVCSTCSFATDVCSAITNSSFVKGLIVSPLQTGLQTQVKTLLTEYLCTAVSPTLVPSCPTGSSPDTNNQYCVFDADQTKCVSTLLGTDSHADLGGLLASISPSTAGGVDFGLAAGGAMLPLPGLAANASGRTPNGITLGLSGGVIPQPASKCVPQATLTLPTGIPMPDELAPTTPDPGNASHVGLALAGRFLQYALGNVYNSGLLCLDVSSDQVSLLSTSLVSLIIPSVKTLAYEESNAAAAISTRPQMPPTIVIGGGTDVDTDPLLTISLPKFALDFYVWHLDRYVRAFTYEADFTIPVNLQTSAAGITPQLGTIGVANGTVTNSDLLFDDPATIATSLNGLVGGLGKQIVGNGFSPINPASALSSFGLGVEFTQIGKLTKGTDDFIGMFATLQAAPVMMMMDTKAVMTGKIVPTDHMQLSTMDAQNLPSLTVDLSSPTADQTRPAEYAWWIDNGTRSAWSTQTHLVVRDNQLLLQGHHVLHVVSRVVGIRSSEDATPAEIPFTIDALAPFATVTRSGNVATLTAHDVVSKDDTLLARYRVNGAAFGDWQPASALATFKANASDTLDVEVKDEEGNVRSVSESLSGQNGGPTSTPSSCSCSTPGARPDSTNGTLALALGAAALAFVLARRRGSLRSPALSKSGRLMLAAASIGTVAATTQGCGCGSDSGPTTGCGGDCNSTCLAPLPLGLPGSYTSVVKAADGTVWVAGYNDALLDGGDDDLFGDLVVGKYDDAKQAVAWATVDGLPAPRTDGSCPDRPADSWRNGEIDSGDDVGLWTSIQVSSDGRPMVSYYDATNKQLKFAVGTLPTSTTGAVTWSTFVLRAPPTGGDAGRYSKMLLVNGLPVVAFLQIENGNGGAIRSKVVVARASTTIPASSTDFAFEDAAVVEDNPCSASSCGVADACVVSTGLCTATVTGCTPADCGSGKACVPSTTATPACVATPGTTQTYPPVFGDYVSLAQNGSALGMVVYDRPHGNLVALTDQGGGTWSQAIIDGQTGSTMDGTALDTGDTGFASSLKIDAAGVWHVTYANLDGTLRYLEVTAGTAATPEIVDDGTTADGMTFSDGKHQIGDSAIDIDGANVIVYYQDATIGTLRKATGVTNGAEHTWTVATVPQAGKFAGYFPQPIPGDLRVTNFWETTDSADKTRTGDVAILTP